MGNGEKATNWDRVLIDICTQSDYLDAGAILQVANSVPLVRRLRQIFDWARNERIGTFSSVESHRPSEPLAGFPLHCIDGTPGQAKLDFTYLPPFFLVEVDNTLALPPNLGEDYQQLIFRKRARDILSNPKADRFLTSLKANDFIIFGVGLERAIRTLALGLLGRNKRVTVVSDACGYWNMGDADLVMRQLAAKRVRIVTTDELTAAPDAPPRRNLVHRPILSSCEPCSSSPASRVRSRAHRSKIDDR